MRCDFADSVLQGYFDCELSTASADEFERHLEDCAACASELVELDILSARLKVAPLYEVAPPSLKKRIRNSLRPVTPTTTMPRQIPWHWLAVAAVLLATLLAFSGLGILSASYLLLFKRGNPAKWLVLGISGLVGGMMYPVSVLPHGLRILARLIPVTYSLEGMRAALLAGAGWGKLWPSIAALLMFAALLIPCSFAVFAWALRRTRVTGTLTHI